MATFKMQKILRIGGFLEGLNIQDSLFLESFALVHLQIEESGGVLVLFQGEVDDAHQPI